MVQVNVKYKGPIFKGVGNVFIDKMKKSANEIAQIVIDKARARYLEVKVASPKLPSAIFDSFDSTVPTHNGNEVRKTVFAGGPSAPHMVFVVYDRVLPNGVMWSSVNPNAPYNFMEVGRDAGEKAAPDIVKNNFK